MSEPLAARSKEEIAFELVRSLIEADENYQQELKLYSECIGTTVHPSSRILRKASTTS
jgi:hypothetical protein